jgi:putative ABC transport system substrate-binding protein
LIERRVLLRAAGLALLAAPLETRAQSGRTAHRIGFLGGASASGYAPLVQALRQGLRDHGYAEGSNLTVEHRWADGQYDRLAALAAEMVRLKVGQQATRLELVINLKTAQTLGVTIPPALIARADAVIR